MHGTANTAGTNNLTRTAPHQTLTAHGTRSGVRISARHQSDWNHRRVRTTSQGVRISARACGVRIS